MKSIKQRLAEGERTVVCGIGRVPHPVLIHIIGNSGGFHGIWLDIEHGGLTASQIETAALTARGSQLDSFCRIPPDDYSLVTRCYEAAAGGVLAAQIRSADHARAFVRMAKFFPEGNRGLNTSGFDGGYGSRPVAEMCADANREGLVGIQIETLGALEECEEIASIPGVDLLFLGPADMSQALGVPGDFFHEKCEAAVRRIADACRSNNKPWGAVTLGPAHAEMLGDHGCLLFSPCNDVKTFAAGLSTVKQQHKSLFAGS